MSLIDKTLPYQTLENCKGVVDFLSAVDTTDLSGSPAYGHHMILRCVSDALQHYMEYAQKERQKERAQ